MSSIERNCRVVEMGVVPYADAFALQKEAVARRQRGEGEDVLMLLQHPHVITLGRNADGGALTAAPDQLTRLGVELVESDRGGDVTYHGPGQVVGYPVLALEDERRDLRRYVRDLEETLIRALGDFGIAARRHADHRGVWVGDRKIASLGIRISRWVTCHGFALNVATDLQYFRLMHPCGIAGCEMTTMARELGALPALPDVHAALCRHFGDVFGRDMHVAAADDIARSAHAV